MNARQKSYDSYNGTTKLLKLTNSYYHFRNLELIKNRSSQYADKPLSLSPKIKPRLFNPFQIYLMKKDNKNIKQKLKNILLKPIKPNMNDNFLIKDKKMKEFRKLQNNMYNKKIEKANQNFKKRLYNQKAFIDPKMMDKLYSVEHSKLLRQIRKIGNNFLPPIKCAQDNMSFMDFYKCSNLDSSRSGRDDEYNNDKSKRKFNSSLSNTNLDNNKDNNKDSGNNSFNK